MILLDSVFVIIHWEWFRNDSVWFYFRNYSLGWFRMIPFSELFIGNDSVMIPRWFCMISFSELCERFQKSQLKNSTKIWQFTLHCNILLNKKRVQQNSCTRKRHSFALILVHALACPVEAKISAPAHISKLYPVATKLSPGFQVFELFGAHSRAFMWLIFSQKCLAMNSTCQSQSNRLKPEC